MKRLLPIMLSVTCLIAFTSLSVAAKEVEVEVFAWQVVEPALAKYFASFKEAFEADNPGIKVTLGGVTPKVYNSKLLTRIGAGDAPDIFQIRPTMVKQLIKQQALYNIKDQIAKADWKDRLLESQRLGETPDGVYAVVMTATPQVLVYNKAILAEAGVPGPPTNPQEIKEIAQKIYDKTGRFGFGVISDTTHVLNMNQAALKWSLGFGGGLAKKGVPTANDPKTVEGIRFWKELYDAPYTPKGAGSAQLRELMWEGKLAMWIDGAWLFGMVQAKNPAIYEQLDAAHVPTPTKAAIVGGAYWGVSSRTENIEATWKVMDYFNRPEWQQKYVEMTSQIPGQKGMVTKEFAAKNPWLDVYEEAAAKYSAGHGYIPEGFDLVAERYHQIVADYLARIFSGSAPLEKTLDELQAELVNTFMK